MVTVDGEYGYPNVIVGIFVINGREAGNRKIMGDRFLSSEKGKNSSLKSGAFAFHRIAEEFYLHWVVAHSVLAQKRTGAIDTLPTWLILVEEISGKKNKVDLRLMGQ